MIIISAVAGHYAAAAAADTINAALNGAAPLTITGRDCTGDVVWLAPRTEPTWIDDAVRLETTNIARELDHPEHGKVLYAWIDMDRLDQAPQLIARRAKGLRNTHAAARAAAAAHPSCDYCGNCPKCC